jgi:hypothetical protein
MDAEMRSELENFRHYEILNNEQITPRFLALSKIRKKPPSLDSIRKEDGSAFNSAEEREEFICSFYERIYQPDPGNTPLNDTVVEDFLGPEICNNPVVINSKLNNLETEFFDRDITLIELDNAVQKLNEKSAGGLDGISSKFIKKFWHYIRLPLHKYTIYCLERGTLTQSFTGAGIKLIPKKCDPSKIKNWRPISLLNCIFKVIAIAMDNRLKKLNEIILTRAQKGFTKNRQIQECIINTIETIAYSEKNNVPGFVLALDMAKAFDTVRHDFMEKVYKFYGIGPKMIKFLNAISTGRTAAILREDGSTARPIQLRTGFPQGSPPSPDEFNICEQILLLKFEFDSNIEKIKPNGILAAGGPVPVPIPVPAPPPVPVFNNAMPGPPP